MSIPETILSSPSPYFDRIHYGDDVTTARVGGLNDTRVVANKTDSLDAIITAAAIRVAHRGPQLTAVSLNYSLPSLVVVACLLSVLAIATAFGNLLVGLALFRYRQLRTISNCLIGNLALSDFLLATTVMPLSIANECLGRWTFGPVVCRAWLVMDVLYCTASIWNLCLIGVDRFTATLYPVWYRDRRSARRRPRSPPPGGPSGSTACPPGR